jgi:hypothetical protein
MVRSHNLRTQCQSTISTLNCTFNQGISHNTVPHRMVLHLRSIHQVHMFPALLLLHIIRPLALTLVAHLSLMAWVNILAARPCSTIHVLRLPRCARPFQATYLRVSNHLQLECNSLSYLPNTIYTLYRGFSSLHFYLFIVTSKAICEGDCLISFYDGGTFICDKMQNYREY